MTVRRAIALGGLAAIALGGCHGRQDTAGTLDAGADARARTAAKTNADLQAAEAARATPLPRAAVVAPTKQEAPHPSAPADRDDEPAVNTADPDPR